MEGITLDLTDISGGIVVIPAAAPKEKPAPKEKRVPKEKKAAPTIEHVDSILKSLEKTCADCKQLVFYSPRSWGNLQLCYTCHRTRYLLIVKEIEEYMAAKGHINCAFCNKERTNPHDFHLDHINMYSKTGSVGPMMFSGAPIDAIKEEIDKCQLLCISCHAAVTAFEHKFGFIRAKRTNKNNPTQYNMEHYDTYMGAVYAALRLHGTGGKA